MSTRQQEPVNEKEQEQVNKPEPEIVDKPEPETVDEKEPEIVDKPEPEMVDEKGPEIVDKKEITKIKRVNVLPLILILIIIIVVIGALAGGLKMRKRIGELEGDIETSSQKLDAQSKIATVLNEELTKAREEISNFQKELLEQGGKGAESEQRKKGLEALLDRQKEEYRQLQVKLSKVQKDKEMVEQGKGRVEDALAEKEKQVKNLEQKTDAQTKDIIALNKKLTKAQGEISNSQKELAKAKYLKQKVEKEKTEKEKSEQQLQKEVITIRHTLGLTYQKTGHYKKAEGEYLRILSLDPNNSNVHYNLGVLYDDCLNNKKKAIYHYRQYVELSPEAKDVKLVKEWILEARWEK